jgi:hypothetical protein
LPSLTFSFSTGFPSFAIVLLVTLFRVLFFDFADPRSDATTANYQLSRRSSTMRSTQVLSVLALLAASVSSMSIAPPAHNLAHRRHASEVTHNAVLQARAARKRNMSGLAEAAELAAAAKRDVPRRVRKRGVNARRCAVSLMHGTSAMEFFAYSHAN